MRALRLARAMLDARGVSGFVVARDLRDTTGRIVFSKGHVLTSEDASQLCDLTWDELHLIAPDASELHEDVAGERLVRAAAGPGAGPGGSSAGHWPILALHRGVLVVNETALAAVNGLDGIAVYTLYDQQVVDAGESIGRAKIVPFVIAGEIVANAETMAREAGGLVSVRPFIPVPIGAIVQESLGPRALSRFHQAFGEKVTWFGAPLLEPRFVVPDASAIAAGVDQLRADGARILVIAGSRPMDPLDPVFDALDRLGARMERRGVPAHPGSLLWLARLGEIPVVGMPSCGLFSQATVFDLVLARFLVGERVDAEWLGGLGHGGFLTRDMAFRFPPYRPARERGEVT